MPRRRGDRRRPPDQNATYAQRSTAPAYRRHRRHRQSAARPAIRGDARLASAAGRRDATAFHLEAGGCACSRPATGRRASSSPAPASRTSCTSTPRTEPVWLGTDPPPIDGWAANVTFLDHLSHPESRLSPSRPAFAARLRPFAARPYQGVSSSAISAGADATSRPGDVESGRRRHPAGE